MKNYINYFQPGGYIPRNYTKEQIKKQQQWLLSDEGKQYGYTGTIDGYNTRKDKKKSGTATAIEKALADGWIIDGNGNIVKQQKPQQTANPRPITTGGAGYIPSGYGQTTIGSSIIDNMYPYSYGDKLVNTSTGEEIPYEGEIPEGWVLRQTTSKDDPIQQIRGFVNKVTNAFSGKDPRKTYMEQLAELDLSTSEGKAKWKELAEEAKKAGVIRISGNPINDQWEIRARLDNISMYNNGTQKGYLWQTNDILARGNNEVRSRLINQQMYI